MGAIVGYARTSTAEQHAGLEDQIAELKAADCDKLYSEQVSSVDAARPQLTAALDFCRDGDTFVVTKPCRLARNVRGLLDIVETLKGRGVTVRILSMNVDTSSATGLLILQVLGAVSQWERSIMLERQRAGIRKAKLENKYRGRAPTARAKASDIIRLHGEGKKVSEIVAALGVSRASVYRMLSEDA